MVFLITLRDIKGVTKDKRFEKFPMTVAKMMKNCTSREILVGRSKPVIYMFRKFFATGCKHSQYKDA